MPWDSAADGYLGVRAKQNAETLSNISALSHLQGMQKAAVDAEAANAERMRQGAFRQDVAKLSELGQAPTHDQLRGLMMKHGVVSPKDLMANDLGMYRADMQKQVSAERLAGTMQMAAARLQQSGVNMNSANAQRYLKAVVDYAKMKDELPASAHGMLVMPTPEMFNLGGQPSAGQPPAPMGGSAPTIAPTVTPAEIMRISDPQERAAQAGAPIPLSAMNGAPQAPTASTAPAAPRPLTLADAPPDLDEKRKRQWLLDRSKQTLSGGKIVGDFTKTGKEFVASLPEEDRAFVEKLASYDIDPKTLSTRGGEREKYLRMAVQADPTFDQKNYNMVNNAVNKFATGTQGNTVRSLNVAVEHIDTARRLGEALQNKNLQVFNQMKNVFAEQTGKPAPSNFNAVKEILADEIVKGVIGNGAGALADREGAAKKVKDASSPAQLNGVLNSWLELMGGQIKGLEKQYEGSTLGKKDFRDRYLTPRALAAIEGVSVDSSNKGNSVVNDAPPGVDPKVWAHMSPEGKKLWQTSP